MLSGAGSAVPVPAVRLVVDLDDVLARGRHDAAGVEHHAGHGVVVGVGVVDGACAEIPYLAAVSKEIWWMNKKDRNMVKEIWSMNEKKKNMADVGKEIWSMNGKKIKI